MIERVVRDSCEASCTPQATTALPRTPQSSSGRHSSTGRARRAGTGRTTRTSTPPTGPPRPRRAGEPHRAVLTQRRTRARPVRATRSSRRRGSTLGCVALPAPTLGDPSRATVELSLGMRRALPDTYRAGGGAQRVPAARAPHRTHARLRGRPNAAPRPLRLIGPRHRPTRPARPASSTAGPHTPGRRRTGRSGNHLGSPSATRVLWSITAAGESVVRRHAADRA